MNFIDTIFIKLGIKNRLLQSFCKLFFPFLKIPQLSTLLDEMKGMKGVEFVDHFFKKYNITCLTKNIDKIPSTGPCVIVANHPTGLMDGMSLLYRISKIRSDIKIVGNYLYQDIEVIKTTFDNIFIYVNPFDREKGKQSSHKGLKEILTSLDQGMAVLIFPSGDISKIDLTKLRIADCEWNQTSVKLLYKANAPIVPVYLNTKNSLLFYILNTISSKLGLMLIFREAFEKANSTVTITIGDSFSPAANDNYDEFKTEIAKRVYDLKHKRTEPSHI